MTNTCYRLVDEPRELRSALSSLGDPPEVAVDVERADWNRYFRTAALVQVGASGQVLLVDPLAIDDLAPLATFLQPRSVILHAMENDLAPLEADDVVPPNVEDTAIAAAILGLPTGLGALHRELLGIELEADKAAMQRADWEARPLTDAMLAYAAEDVVHLLDLWAALRDRLETSGRWHWYVQEREAERAQPSVEDRRSWGRLKGIGRLDPRARGRARALWETREELAKSTDTAPSRIVGDKVIVDLAADPPSSPRQLGARGVRRQAVHRFGDQIVDALARAPEQPLGRRAERRATDDDRAAAERLRAVRAAIAEELGIDAGVLCPSRTLLDGVLADPGSGEELREALGLRSWQWDLLREPFCEALGIGPAGTAPERSDRDEERSPDDA
ncbi:ribonuclease D [Egibacter rhizosphaerae]|uniref:ribonuclease D n=1 Tax=Egibacter rhizosphaerae TaxID=1670831 RepID=UPI0013F14E21|nr:HRDC domain-containing protein [Egibacter rhizosphaerae]